MILLIICVSALTWASSKCEPPVNSYLPPSNNGGGRPSSQYGPPERGGGSDFGGNRPGQSGFGRSPPNNYLPPGQSSSTKLDNQYGAPSSGNFGQDSPQGRGEGRPNPRYGNPNQSIGPSSRLTDNQYSLPGSTGASDLNNIGASNSRGTGFGQKPDNSYGASPSDVHSANSQIHSGGFRPSQESARQEGPSSRFQDGFGGRPASPSSSYGAPGLDRTGGERRPNFEDGDTDVPAKYEFNYDVDDSQTGTKFGHSEQRDGDLATGEYNVVLPDGRKQVVEYEAGLDGFKPQIRYEGTPQVGNRGGNGAYHGSGNSHGFPEPHNDQPGQLGQYQEANTYPNAETELSQVGPGYPSGRPGNGKNGQRNGYSSGNSGQQVPGQSYPGPNDGSQAFNGDNQDYSRCTNGNNRGPQGRSCSGSGDDNGRSKNGYNSSPRGEEGYPSGRPNGPIGTGY